MLYKIIYASLYFKYLEILPNQGERKVESTIYEDLHLGLLHTLLGFCIKNPKLLVLVLITINMAVGSSDTWSDVMIFEFLCRAKFWAYA